MKGSVRLEASQSEAAECELSAVVSMIELGCLQGGGSTCANPNQDLFPAM